MPILIIFPFPHPAILIRHFFIFVIWNIVSIGLCCYLIDSHQGDNWPATATFITICMEMMIIMLLLHDNAILAVIA